MEAVFVHVIAIESELLKTLTLTTFLKLVSDIIMLLKFIDELLGVVSSIKAENNKRKS